MIFQRVVFNTGLKLFNVGYDGANCLCFKSIILEYVIKYSINILNVFRLSIIGR